MSGIQAGSDRLSDKEYDFNDKGTWVKMADLGEKSETVKGLN